MSTKPMNYLADRSSRLEPEQAVERAKQAGRREIWFVALLSGALIAPLIAVVANQGPGARSCQSP